MLSRSQYVKLIIGVVLLSLSLLLLPQFRTQNGLSAIGMLIVGVIGIAVVKDLSAKSPRYSRFINWAIMMVIVISVVVFLLTITAGAIDGQFEIGTALLLLSPLFALLALYLFWFSWGMLLAIRGNYDGAIKHYSLLARITPDSAHPYSNRALIYAVKGDHDRALSDYQRAIDLATTDPQKPKGPININHDVGNLYAGRSAVWIAKKDYEAAVADATKGLGLVLDTTVPMTRFSLLYNRGLAYLELGRYAEAAADFDAAPLIALNAKQQTAWKPHLIAHKAFAARGLGQDEQVLTLWREALVHQPKFADVNWLRETLKWSDAKVEAAQALNALT